jgi:hypothetical protein
MKSKFAVLSVLLLTLLSAGLFAATKNSDSVTFFDSVKVGGTELAAGEYKVVWNGDGPDVQVSFLQGKKTVATAPARLVKEQNSSAKAVRLRTEADNSRVVTGIDFKKLSLVFEEPTAAQGN